jgi:bifunctional UDP-N-acetylglucosamine pyrophosphorylase/glucosamine-1-phosphate N-acetyltransferase
VEIVRQETQLGTGHAVDQARAALDDFDGTVIVLYGDCPLIQPRTLEELTATLSTAAVSVLGFEAENPARYGRLITDGDRLKRIVEFKDATPAERAVRLCNSGVMAASAELLFDLLSEIDANNASGELYLTDVIGKAVGRGLSCTAIPLRRARNSWRQQPGGVDASRKRVPDFAPRRGFGRWHIHAST